MIVDVAAGESIQNAYDGLPSGGGVLRLGAGVHNVGDGLILDRTKPAAFVGVPRYRRRWREPLGADGIHDTMRSHTVLVGNGPSLIDITSPATNVNGYGFLFRSIVCYPRGAAAETAIRAVCLSNLRVEDCGFYFDVDRQGHPAPRAIDLWVDDEFGDDASWSRIIDCQVMRAGLVRFGRQGVYRNLNQHVIRDNQCHGRGPDFQVPAIEGHFLHRTLISGNNLEGYAVGTRLASGSRGNVLIGNGGEQVSAFVEIDPGHANLILDSGVSYPDMSDRLVRILAGADNLTIAATATGMSDLYQRAVDNLTSDQNWVIAPSGFAARSDLRVGAVQAGPGDPEGTIIADPGTIWIRTDGPPWLYVKETGYTNPTGWTAKIS